MPLLCASLKLSFTRSAQHLSYPDSTQSKTLQFQSETSEYPNIINHLLNITENLSIFVPSNHQPSQVLQLCEAQLPGLRQGKDPRTI
jgi:hypothetical protein